LNFAQGEGALKGSQPTVFDLLNQHDNSL